MIAALRMSCRFLALGMLLILFPLLPGCAVNPVTGKAELAFYSMSEQEEISLGRKAFPQAVQQMEGEYDDPRLKEYINSVGQRLARVSHRPGLPYTFKVVNDSQPNAFAVPGGNIAITRGLLVDLENEAQLAAVLGHEIGHVTARHSLQNLQRGILLNLGLQVLALETGGTTYSALSRQAGQIAGAVISSSYSRDEEREADRLGIDYMVRASYNPQGAVQLQEYFMKKSGEQDPLWISGLFRTHPFSGERMRDNQNYIESVYAGILRNDAYTLAAEGFLQAIRPLRESREAFKEYDRGKERERANDLAGAISLYEQAARKAPGQSLLHNGLGLAYLKANRLGEAKKSLHKAADLNGEYFETHFGLGYAYLKEGDLGRAKMHLEKSMKLMPTLGSAFFLAETYEKSASVKEAFQLYKQVAEADSAGKLGKAAAGRAQALARQYGGR
ncbi:M48 family metalloprotease [Thiovibrio sp. JS02]